VCRRPLVVSLVAITVRALALLIIVELVGPKELGRAFDHLRTGWILLIAIGELFTYPAYILAYRSVSRMGREADLTLGTLARVVVAGFGPVAIFGGFSLDRNALRSFDQGDARAALHVSAMSTLEWAVLAPATWVVVLILLITNSDVSGTLLWPWALGLPLGIALVLLAIRPAHAKRLSRRRGHRITLVADMIEGVRAVIAMARAPRRFAWAWVGTSLYWGAEATALYGALRAVGLDLGVARTVLAYSSGYVASRRALPLGGAGLTEALLIYSLYSLGEPVGPSVAAVMLYRMFNFMTVVIPALIAHRGLTMTLLIDDPAAAS
jgi:uncharacterized membrane protein YbhN (UPF0104 family)